MLANFSRKQNEKLFFGEHINSVWQKVHRFKLKFGVLIVVEIEQQIFHAATSQRLFDWRIKSGVSFINILGAHILLISFRQKVTKSNCN